MASTTSAIKWTKIKEWDCEYHELRYKNFRSYVYGGYQRGTKLSSRRANVGWFVNVRLIDQRLLSTSPNKLHAETQFKRLKDAKAAAVAAPMLFIALCLIKNKKPEHMEMNDV